MKQGQVTLPPGWALARVGELGDVKLGRQRAPEHHSGPYMRPYLRVANVFEGRIDATDVMKMNFTPREFETYRLRNGDILLNEGQSVELVGRAAIFREEVPDACFQNTLVRFRSGPAVLHEFALLVFHAYLHSGRFQKIARWTTNIAHLGAQRFADLDFAVPPVPEQRRIVEEASKHLTRLDAAVADLRRAKANLARYRAAVLKAACEGRLGSEAPVAQSAEQSARPRGPSGERPPTPLPAGWRCVRVDELGEVRLGRQRSPKHHSGRHMRPYLRVANVFEARIDISDVMQMNFTPDEYEVYRLQAGDILLNEGQSLELVGRPAMYRDEVPGACFQNTLVRFRSGPQVLPEFALTVFRAYLHAGRFQKIAKWTTNIAHLGAGRFAGLDFPLPALAEQRVVVQRVEAALSEVDGLTGAIDRGLAQSNALRQSILRAAFEGRLVPQNPSDEPASLLLARIREQQAFRPGDAHLPGPPRKPARRGTRSRSAT